MNIDELSRQGEAIAAGLKALPSAQRLSAEALESIYSLARGKLDQGQHEQALNFFGLLAMYSPGDPRGYAGMALTYLLAQSYVQALQMYSLAGTLAPGRPEYMVRMAECLLHLGWIATGQKLLELVVHQFAAGEGQEPMRRRAQAMLDLLAHEPAAA
jgi:tetratricopeptide (TPR) repeat protein